MNSTVRGKSLAKIEADFKKFMGSDKPYGKNKWLYSSIMSVYVRHSGRYIEEKILECIEIGNVEVAEKYRGTGVFRWFMELVESYGLPIYIENIFSERILSICQKNGYIILDNNPPCAVKFFKLEEK